MNSFLKCFSIVLLFCAPSLAQTPTIPNYTPYENHGDYSINLQNLSIILSASIRSKNGLIGFGANSKGVTGTYGFGPGGTGSKITGGTGGLQQNASANNLIPGAVRSRSNGLVACSSGGQAPQYIDFYFSTGDGNSHQLPSSVYLDCNHPSFTAKVLDGSGYTVSVSRTAGTIDVYSTGGLHLSGTFTNGIPIVSFYSYTDTNGNTVSYTLGTPTTFTDSVGLTALSSSGIPPTFSWTDVNGGTQQTVFSTTSLTAKTVFGCALPNGDINNATATNYVTHVAYADGKFFGITYETTLGYPGHTTGRISGLTLPFGGSVSFTYSGFQCSYLEPNSMSRTTTDGAWTYAWAPVLNGSVWIGNTTTVTDPAGNQTVYTFRGVPGAINSWGAGPVLVQVVTKQGSGTALSTQTLCYNGNLTNCTTTTPLLPIIEIDTYTQLSGMSTSNRSKVTYDSYGNELTRSSYDFGASSPSFVTTTVYGSWNGTSCSSLSAYNVNDKPCSVVTTDGTNTLSTDYFAYDSNGNNTDKWSWTGSGTTLLHSSATYNSNGTVATSSAVDGVQTSLTYGSGGCGSGAFPTQTTVNGVSSYATWNCDGGVQLTSKDANNNIVTTGYLNSLGAPDPLWRMSSMQDPVSNIAYQIYGTTTREGKFTFGSSLQDSVKTLDAYGRSYLSQKKHGPSYDTVSALYGFTPAVGAFAKSSAPCSQALGSPCSSSFTTTTLDGAGRPYTVVDPLGKTVAHTYAQNDVTTVLSPHPTGENNKTSQVEVDGLGRVKSTCNIISGSTNSCGQAVSAFGTVTTMTYSTFSGGATTTAARGSQSRSKTVDALGRVTNSSDPETGATTFYYDVQAACPGSLTGHLAETVDAKGNVVCFAYDTATGRLVKTSANGTDCRHLYYDNSNGFTGTKPTGVTVSNPYGHMVAASTSDCSGNLKTDEWFSFDTRGQVTDMWESTPHSGGYYHTTATYNANMTVASIGGIPGYTTETYGLDGDGRVVTAKESSTWVVNGVTFNSFGEPLTVGIGNSGGDSDAYSYDSVTGNMTNWTFTVGATPVAQTGAITWNPIGTLQKLVIGDGFNSGGAQTCNFSYDDLNRLVTDDCGSGNWGQNFSFDQYDNLTKSVISGRTGTTWNPGYSSSNNRYTLSGTSYDNNGNLLTDGLSSTYTYNGFNRLATINGTSCGTSGTCVTYDALGRVVERSVNSTYTEFLYSPGTGSQQLASMSGQTTSDAHIPMPGGAVLYKTSDSHREFWHMDWLGSARLGSDVATRVYTFDRGFSPYGETTYNYGLTTELGFTGDLQYLQAGVLFDAANRELNPSQGRWTQPDPARAAWNLYAYPTNPNSAIDPSGLAMLNIGREAGTPFSGDAAMQQEAEWDSLGIGTVTADQYQNPADDQSNSTGCWCLAERWHNMRKGMGFYSNAQLQQIAAGFARDMTDAGYLIGGVKAAVALRGKSDEEIIRAYRDYEEAKDNGTLEALPAVVFAADQIQAKFKHAGDFGVNGNWNKTTAAEYDKALRSSGRSGHPIHRRYLQKNTVGRYLLQLKDRKCYVGGQVRKFYQRLEVRFYSGYRLNDERKHSMTKQDSKTSKVSLLPPEAWSGGHYELSILLGERDHDRASSAVRVLWSYPLIDGPYASKQDLSEAQHRVDPSEALERELYGLASLTPEIRVPCGSTLIRFDDGPDWIQLYLPLGSISAFFRTGGFPFDKDHQRQKWEEDLDSWLVGVAKHVFARVRFELALVGFEVETARFSKAKMRASPLSERQFEGVLLPSEGQLKWFPPTS